MTSNAAASADVCSSEATETDRSFSNRRRRISRKVSTSLAIISFPAAKSTVLRRAWCTTVCWCSTRRRTVWTAFRCKNVTSTSTKAQADRRGTHSIQSRRCLRSTIHFIHHTSRKFLRTTLLCATNREDRRLSVSKRKMEIPRWQLSEEAEDSLTPIQSKFLKVMRVQDLKYFKSLSSLSNFSLKVQEKFSMQQVKTFGKFRIILYNAANSFPAWFYSV